jgi:hypothetical protein
VVTVAESGREHRQPEENGGLRRLRDRPDREDEPAAPHALGAP